MANYVAKKSAWSEVTFFGIIACILIIPIFILIGKIIIAKKYRIEFYDDKIITYQGVINVRKKQVAFGGVTGVSVNKGLKGRIFNFGDVEVDCVGEWDVDTYGVKDPDKLEEYLQTKIVNIANSNQFVHM